MADQATHDDPTFGDRTLSVLSRFLPRRADRDNIHGLIRAYGHWLFAMARGLSDKADDPLGAVATRLEEHLQRRDPDLSEVFAIEMQLVRLLPDEIIQRRYWEFRTRFEQVASPVELAAYLAAKPPMAGSGSAAAISQPDLLVLLSHIHRSYLLTVLREKAVRDLKRWIQNGLMRALFFYALLMLVLLFLSTGPKPLVSQEFLYFGIGIVLLYLLGRLGAATSVVQRLQKAVREHDKDAFFEITALCAGRRGISIAMMTGGIFALLLYVVFGAGLGQHLGMSGGLFPRVEAKSEADRSPESGEGAAVATSETSGGGDKKDEVGQVQEEGDVANQADAEPAAEPAEPVARVAETPPSTESAALAADAQREAAKPEETVEEEAVVIGKSKCEADSSDCMPSFVTELGKHLGFQGYPDFFKMLILAFLAGFAERLVPDAIDRLVQRRTTETKKVEATVVAPS